MTPLRGLWILAFLVAGGLAYVVYTTPMNCNDFLMHLFLFETRDLEWMFRKHFIETRWHSSDWRPLQYVSSHAFYLAVRGHEHLAFKGLLAASVLTMTWLFVRLLPVTHWRGTLAAATALLILVGHHSFAGAVEGVYPYGVEIILLIFELLILGALLLHERTVASEIMAVVVSLVAILLNEKGGLVGVTYIVGSALRLPGASRRAAVALFLAYVFVVAVRFGYYTGFGGLKGRHEAEATSSLLFDLVAPALNVLLSDPRFGRFRVFPLALAGQPWAIVTAASSVAILVLIVMWAACTFDRRQPSTEHKVLALLPFMLVGSMMFGAFSRKDYIPIMALPVYALVSFYALRWFLSRGGAVRDVLGASLGLAWALRAAGLVYYLYFMGEGAQREWLEAEKYGMIHEFDRAMAVPIMERLRAEALAFKLPHPDTVLPAAVIPWLRGRGCPELCRD
jgi:hypothetical protein